MDEITKCTQEIKDAQKALDQARAMREEVQTLLNLAIGHENICDAKVATAKRAFQAAIDRQGLNY